ncbi:peptidylprolyl isomerase [Nonlabens sp. Hel1_33_55]|uniref:peptidylprolyl isomerase n=1 Tax=Nonlabens sp. Hel1_33_55 TaxID=1336802 RepID=UPI000875AC2E|nr:peptidylprolyl isomerase [Nonlabens sp. Hel1_33_55]SCY03352.1 peptidylprolyl isomerase [Nonlabens sp. Hel1_33_55]
MKKIHGLLLILAIILTAASCKNEYPDIEDGIYAEFKTTKGTMLAELYYKATPTTVANFVALTEGNHEFVLDSLKGKPYYDGLVFHRVIDSFMIQGGDYTGTGSGQVGYQFAQEIVDTLKHDEKGILSMANAGPNTNGSQFFIMDEPNANLDGGYNVFGKVIEGLAVIDSISTVATNPRDNRPLDSVVMKSVKIIRKGKDAQKWDAVKTFKEGQELAEQERLAAEKLAEDRRAAAPAKRQAKAVEFADLKSKASKLPNSNVMIYTVSKGTGAKPEEGTRVLLEYSGFLENGNLFDSSDIETAQEFDALNPNKERANMYRPIPVQYSNQAAAIPGFRDALLSMNYGDKIVAFIPSEFAYGEAGNGPIPPNSNLIFEMELMENDQ